MDMKDIASALCERCGGSVSQTHAVLEASGHGYTLTVTGVPVSTCRRCRTSQMISEYGELNLDAIISATVTALETLAPHNEGEQKYLTQHCRNCRTKLPDSVDPVRAHFRANAAIGTTSELVGVDYYGSAFTCPSCLLKHPHLPSPLYHKIKDSVTRAAQHYLPG